MLSPASPGNSEGGSKDISGTEPTRAAKPSTLNEGTTASGQASQSTETASTFADPISSQKISYKLLSKRRRLANSIKCLKEGLSGAPSLDWFNKLAPDFHSFVNLYSEFRCEIEDLSNPSDITELICDLADDYDKLCSSFKTLELRFGGNPPRDENDVDVAPSDSASQVSSTRTSSTSRSSTARRIELECKRASLRRYS